MSVSIFPDGISNWIRDLKMSMLQKVNIKLNEIYFGTNIVKSMGGNFMRRYSWTFWRTFIFINSVLCTKYTYFNSSFQSVKHSRRAYSQGRLVIIQFAFIRTRRNKFVRKFWTSLKNSDYSVFMVDLIGETTVSELQNVQALQE